MRTTVDLPDDLFRQLKIKAATDGMSLKRLMVQALESEVRPAAKPLYRVELPLVHSKGRKKINLTNAEIEDLLT